jgi:hypothetical protein
VPVEAFPDLANNGLATGVEDLRRIVLASVEGVPILLATWPTSRRGCCCPFRDPRVRFDRNELSGAFGDLGTDFPLVVGMVLAAGLDVTSVLVMFGLMQVLTGLAYGLPMPVQPLKAMAVIVASSSGSGSSSPSSRCATTSPPRVWPRTRSPPRPSCSRSSSSAAGATRRPRS